MSKINITDFPTEILQEIFKHLPSFSNAAVVCRKFYEIASKASEDHVVLTISDYDLAVSSSKIKQMIATSKAVNVDLEVTESSFDENRMRNLQKFLREHGEKIVDVKLSGSLSIVDFCAIVGGLKSSHNLRLRFFNLLDKENVFPQQVDCTSLEVDVAEFTNNREWGDRPSAIQDFVRMHPNFQATINFVKSLRNLKTLRVIDKIDCGEWKIHEILAGKNLEELSFTMMDTVDCTDHVRLGILAQKNLKSLKIPNFYVWSEFFEEMTENLRNLRMLKVNLWIVSSFVFESLSKLTNLTILTVKVKNYEQLEEIPRLKLPSLKKLKIHHHGLTLGSSTATAIAQAFKSLAKIGFCGSVVAAIDSVLTNFNSVECVHLNEENSQNVFADANFLTKSHRNLNLQKLTFCVRSNFGPGIVEKFNRDFPNLRKFTAEPDNGLSVCDDLRSSKNSEVFRVDPFENNDWMNWGEETKANFDRTRELRFKVSAYESTMDEELMDEGVEKFVTFDLNSISELYEVSKFETIMRIQKPIKNLRISAVNAQNEAIFRRLKQAIERFGAHIRELSLVDGTKVLSLSEILQLAPNVENLILRDLNVMKESDHAMLESVKTLELTDCSEHLLNVLKLRDNTLESLTVKSTEDRIEDVSTELLDALVCNQKNSLKSLHVDITSVQDFEPNFLENFQLREVSWSCENWMPTEALVDFLSRQKNLKKLLLLKCRPFHDEHLRALTSLELETFGLYDVVDLSEQGFKLLFDFKNLQQLGLSHSDSYTASPRIFPRLERVYVNEDQDDVSSIFYAALAACMPRLKTLNVIDAGFYSEAAKYENLLRIFNRVEELSLNGTTLPKEALSAENVANPNLKELKVESFYCYELVQFRQIVANYPNLRKLSFELKSNQYRSESQLREAVVEQLAFLLGGLRSLKVFACTSSVAGVQLTLSPEDLQSILRDANSLEFFLLCGAKVENFEEIERKMSQRFEIVRVAAGNLLLCNRKTLATVKDRGSRLSWNFPEIPRVLSENFFRRFEPEFFEKAFFE